MCVCLGRVRCENEKGSIADSEDSEVTPVQSQVLKIRVMQAVAKLL